MSNLTAGEDRIKIVFHSTSAESGFYLVSVRCRRNTHLDLSFFHAFQKIHNTRLRQNLVDIKMLDGLIDACNNLLCRKRQVIFSLEVASRLIKAQCSDIFTHGRLWLFSKGTEIDLTDTIPNEHGIKECSVKVEDRTLYLHAFTISSDNLRSRRHSLSMSSAPKMALTKATPSTPVPAS